MCEVDARVALQLANNVNAAPGGEGGEHMHSSSEQQVVVLECECGEITVILGSVYDWRSRRPIFKCECGQNLTLDGRTEEEVLAAS